MRWCFRSSPTRETNIASAWPTMIQEDLQKIGIHVNVVTLDFPSLIERMTQTFRLRGDSAGADECGTGSERADERVAEFVGESPMESAAEDSRNRVGGRDRPADAGAGFLRRSEETKRELSTGCRRSRWSRRRSFF